MHSENSAPGILFRKFHSINFKKLVSENFKNPEVRVWGSYHFQNWGRAKKLCGAEKRGPINYALGFDECWALVSSMPIQFYFKPWLYF